MNTGVKVIGRFYVSITEFSDFVLTGLKIV